MSRTLRTLRHRLGRGEAGFSLIELLTVMVIMGVVLSAVTQVFVAGSKAEADMGRRFTAQQGARLALEKIRRDIHCATSGSLTTVGGSPTTYRLNLTIPSCSSGNVAWCTVSYGGSSTRFELYRQVGASCASGTGVKQADYLTAANAFPTYTAQSVTSLASQTVDFAVSVKGTSVGAYRLQDTIYLRNSTRT